MRDLEFFDRYDAYVDHLWNEVFTEDWVYNTPFYRNLVYFVADHYSPIFYTISDPSEHFAFSGAYHFETRRQRYPNKSRECLFWLHDFTHMLFPYAWDVWDVSEKQFLADFRYQEWLASTETEVFAYFRVPGLREKVFEDETLYYDVMVERGEYGLARPGGPHKLNGKPDAIDFLGHREKLVLHDDYGEAELGEYPDILAFFQKWRTLTPKWISQRYREVAGIRVPDNYWQRLNSYSYERIINEYPINAHPDFLQERYERNILANIKAAYALLGWEDPPIKWRHVPEAMDSLEGAVFFK